MNLIHLVPLGELASAAFSLRPLCRSWRDGSDWTTRTNVVTCPRCQRLLKEKASMERIVRLARRIA